jgi:hypothetical protein
MIRDGSHRLRAADWRQKVVVSLGLLPTAIKIAYPYTARSGSHKIPTVRHFAEDDSNLDDWC